ncbi:MAG: hypothetical protein GOVbin2950_13 [Prokaryotic dsDNA virus sp.]|nr:MAG: hypothetical protein GOVbin2950_13 [Prokaryotic dsDNA virus sp.]|tara:strand:- start:3109 stop:3324 length:216 start_codon:yes stop_codon:yes gene_type:complete
MVEKDRKLWKAFLEREKQHEINREEIELIARLHAEHYRHKYNEPCTCNGSIYKKWIAEINKIYEITNKKQR